MSTNQDTVRSVGNITRIDYKILNNTGQSVLKPSLLATCNQEVVENSEISEISSQLSGFSIMDNSQDNQENKVLNSKYVILKEEIDDFIDENPTNYTVVSAEDADTCVNKITEFRTYFRQICKDIQDLISPDQFNHKCKRKEI